MPPRWAKDVLSTALFVVIVALGLGSASPISRWSPIDRTTQSVFAGETAWVGGVPDLHSDLFEPSADSDGGNEIAAVVPAIAAPRAPQRAPIADLPPVPPTRACIHDGECCRE